MRTLRKELKRKDGHKFEITISLYISCQKEAKILIDWWLWISLIRQI